jgi:hypothetical protein
MLGDLTMSEVKNLKTLGEDSFVWLKNANLGKIAGRPPTKTNSERQRYHHIRNVALKEIEDLTKLAEILPEDQQSQIFTEQKLVPLIKTLLSFPTGEISREGDNIIYTYEAEQRRQRLLQLCHGIIATLNDSKLAGPLAPLIHPATVLNGGTFAHLSAIYYEAMLGSKQIIVKNHQNLSNTSSPEHKIGAKY